MAIVTWSMLYPEVLPEVPGCPLPMVDNAIRNAAIELCDHALMYRVDLTPIVTVAAQPAYALAYDAETNVAEVIEARTDSRRLDAKTTTDFAVTGAVYEVVTGGSPTHYFQTDSNTLRLYPIPDDVYAVYLKVALKPMRTSTGLEAFIFEQYRDELAAGALSRLMGMSKMPWADKQAALDKKAEFITGKGDARIDGMRNFTTASIKVSPRAFK